MPELNSIKGLRVQDGDTRGDLMKKINKDSMRMEALRTSGTKDAASMEVARSQRMNVRYSDA